MTRKTNLQCLRELEAQDMAAFLCHVIQSGKLTMDGLSEIKERYKDAAPADCECMLAWLNRPAD